MLGVRIFGASTEVAASVFSAEAQVAALCYLVPRNDNAQHINSSYIPIVRSQTMKEGQGASQDNRELKKAYHNEPRFFFRLIFAAIK